LPAHLFLDERNIEYETRTFPETTEKGAANVAHALGFRERQMIKTLIFETAQGECSLVMVGGDQNAISGLLKKALGSRDISLAKPEKVIELTGYVIGSIPPFHWQRNGVKTFLDKALMDEPVLGVGTGKWGNEILITPQNLVTASNAIVVNLTVREEGK
jgi:Cys-tRNA(Pro)/Cys-tRNA(Cys) deacylase